MAKTIHANQQRKIDRPYLAPVYFAHISLPGETLYFSDRWFKYNGHDYEDYIRDLSGLAQKIDQLGGAPNLAARLNFSNARFRGYNTLLEFFDAHPITRRELDLFVLYKDTGETFGSDVSTQLFKAGIGELTNITREKFEAELMSITHLLDSKNPFIQINRTNWPSADPAAIGKYENMIYGYIDDCPCHCVVTGACSTLFIDITSGGTTIYLSDTDWPMPFLDKGTVQIDEEQITYSGKNSSNRCLTGCSRGRNGTTAAIHKRGAPVWQVIPEYKYLVAGHKCKSAADVMVDKLRIADTDYTINLDDGGKTTITFPARAITKNQGAHTHAMLGAVSSIPGASSSVTVDTNKFYYIGQPQNLIDQSEDTYVYIGADYPKAGGGNNTATIAVNFPAWPGGAIQDAWLCIRHRSFRQETSQVRMTTPLGSVILDLSGQIVTQKIAIGPRYCATTNITVEYLYTAGHDPQVWSSVYEVWLEVQADASVSPAEGVWGPAQQVFAPLVTCDVEGFRDDGAGTYTGTPNALIEGPSDIRKHLLVAVLGRLLSEIGASFDSMRATYSGRIIGGYKFACILSRLGEIPSDIFRSMDTQSRSQMREDGGKFELMFNDTTSSPASVLTLDKNNLMGEPLFGQTPQEEIRNNVRAKYFLDWSGFKENKHYGDYFKQTERSDAASITKYGTLFEDLELPAVRIDEMADDVADWILLQKKDVLKTVQVVADWSARKLERGDFFTLIHDFWSGLKWRALEIEEIPDKQQFRIQAIPFMSFEGTTVEVLQLCEAAGDWSTDSAVSGSIVISADATDFKKGTKSIRVDVVQYPKVRYNENGTVTGILGSASASKFWAQGFKPASNFDAKSLAVKLYKKGSPTWDVTLAIYSNNAGIPGTLLGSATIPYGTVPLGAFNAAPNDYLYAMLSSSIPLTAGTLYWLVMSVSTVNLYKYFVFQYDGSNTFGDGSEILRHGSTIAVATSMPTKDLCFRIAAQGDALNKYVFATIASKDISALSAMRSWVRGSKSGNFLSHSFGEAAIGEQNFPLTLSSGNAWEWLSSMIDGVPPADRNGVTKVGFKITDVSGNFWFKFDYLIAN